MTAKKSQTVSLQMRVSQNFHKWYTAKKEQNPNCRRTQDLFLLFAMAHGYEPVDADFPRGTSLSFIKKGLEMRKALTE